MFSLQASIDFQGEPPKKQTTQPHREFPLFLDFLKSSGEMPKVDAAKMSKYASAKWKALTDDERGQWKQKARVLNDQSVQALQQARSEALGCDAGTVGSAIGRAGQVEEGGENEPPVRPAVPATSPRPPGVQRPSEAELAEMTDEQVLVCAQLWVWWFVPREGNIQGPELAIVKRFKANLELTTSAGEVLPSLRESIQDLITHFAEGSVQMTEFGDPFDIEATVPTTEPSGTTARTTSGSALTLKEFLKDLKTTNAQIGFTQVNISL